MWNPIKWWKAMRATDPIHACDLYKAEGCAHVDGMLCDFPDCQMLKDWKMRGEDEITRSINEAIFNQNQPR